MQGVVVKSTGSWYSVLTNDGVQLDCRIRGKFRIQGLKSTNPVAVGDRVLLDLNGEDYLISKILERKNYIIRKSVNLSKQVHIIAANIDQAFLIVTLASPTTSVGFIDRLLVTAEAYQIPTVLVLIRLIYTTSLIVSTTMRLFKCILIQAMNVWKPLPWIK